MANCFWAKRGAKVFLGQASERFNICLEILRNCGWDLPVILSFAFGGKNLIVLENYQGDFVDVLSVHEASIASQGIIASPTRRKICLMNELEEIWI